MTAVCPGVKVPGFPPVSVATGTSPQVMLLIVSFPVFVSVAVNVTSKFWAPWLNVLTQTPAVVVLPFTTAIFGFVVPVQLAGELELTGVLLVAPVPLQEMVSFAWAPVCAKVPVTTAVCPGVNVPTFPPVRVATGVSPQVMPLIVSLLRISSLAVYWTFVQYSFTDFEHPSLVLFAERDD